MKRRLFLKTVIGVLAVPFAPKLLAKAKANIDPSLRKLLKIFKGEAIILSNEALVFKETAAADVYHDGFLKFKG